MKGPPWWCWWRAGANLVALQCDTHKVHPKKTKYAKFIYKSSFSSFSLSCEADAFLSRHGSSWTSGQLSKQIYIPLCGRWMKFTAILKLWNNNDISIFVICGWVLVHMMLGDYLWPILLFNWPIKNCRAKRLQDHSRQGLSVYHALGFVPMCDHHRIRVASR